MIIYTSITSVNWSFNEKGKQKQAFYPICTHGSESVNDNMDEILDYILNKDNCECTTYKDVYDQFRSTALENRIKALEEKLYS